MLTPTQQICDELQIAYDHFNATLFEGRLPPCMLTLQRQKKTRGYFSNKRFVSHDGREIDEIALNPAYFAINPLEVVMSTIVHEMVHLQVHHFGDPGRRGYHNKNWFTAMVAVGLMPSDTGAPGGQTTGEKMSHYILPGGAFEDSCHQLLTQQYRLSWMDRFPPPKSLQLLVSRAENPYPPESHPDSIDSLPAVVSPQDTIGPDETIEHLPAPTLPVPPAVEDAIKRLESLRSLGIPVEEVIAPTTPVKPNRYKYSCPECATNLWGKPGLKVLCGQCSTEGHLVEFSSRPI